MNETLEIPRGFTGALSKAGFAIGDGAKTGFSQAAPNGAGLDFAVNGIACHKADSATNVPFTAATQQALLTKCLYLIQITAAGTYSTKKGDEVLTADLTAGKTALQWPEPDANCCPAGGVKIACASAATFTAGTTALDATNVTATYYDFAGGMPSAGLTS